MTDITDYADFVARHASDKQTLSHPYAFATTPSVLRGDNDAPRIVYLSLPHWVQAHGLMLDLLERMPRMIYAKRHALAIMKALFDMRAPDEALMLYCRCRAIKSHNGKSAGVRTLYQASGDIIAGTTRELMEKTGLPKSHVLDLLNGHRRTLYGWYGSEKEAKRGPLKPGRKRKPEQGATEGTSLW